MSIELHQEEDIMKKLESLNKKLYEEAIDDDQLGGICGGFRVPRAGEYRTRVKADSGGGYTDYWDDTPAW